MDRRDQESRDSSSLDRNFQIRTNTEGENELQIPAWDEGSSDTYTHIIEELRIYKNKCRHLENHLQENMREFRELSEINVRLETHEEELVFENRQLRNQVRMLAARKKEYEMKSQSLEDSIDKRQEEVMEKIRSYIDREEQLRNQVRQLQEQVESLRRRPGPSPRAGEDRWKKQLDEVKESQAQWRLACESMETNFDQKTKELKLKLEEITTLKKANNDLKDEYQYMITGLNNDIDGLKREINRLKQTNTTLENKVKDLQGVIDDVSAKNDQFERDNTNLKKSIKENDTKYNKLDKEYQSLQDTVVELRALIRDREEEGTQNQSTVGQLRIRISSLQKDIKQLKADLEKVNFKNNHLENSNKGLQTELEDLKKRKQAEIEQLKQEHKKDKSQIIKNYDLQKSQNDRRINEKDTEIMRLNQLLAEKTSQVGEQSSIDKSEIARLNGVIDGLKSQLNAAKAQEASYKSQLDAVTNSIDSLNGQLENANNQIKTLQGRLNNPAQGQELRQLRQQLADCERYRSELAEFNSKASKQIDGLTSTNRSLTLNLETARQEKSLIQARVRELELANSGLVQENQRLKSENQVLKNENQVMKNDNQHLLNDNQAMLRDKNQIVIENDHMTIQMKKVMHERDSLLKEKQLWQQEKSRALASKTQKERQFERIFKQKVDENNELARKLIQLEKEVISLRNKGKQETKDNEKIKRLEVKVKGQENEIDQLEGKVNSLELEQEEMKTTIKGLEKQNKTRQIDLVKKDKKIKEIEAELDELLRKVSVLEHQLEEKEETIQALTKSVKNEQLNIEKLKLAVQKLKDKEKKAAEEPVQDKEAATAEWLVIVSQKDQELAAKNEQIARLTKEIASLKDSLRKEGEAKATEQQLRKRNEELLEEIRIKDERLRQFEKVRRQQAKGGSVEDLEAEYERELLALKRLLAFKASKEEEPKPSSKLSAQEEQKLQMIMVEYRAMQEELLILRQSLVAQRVPVPVPVLPPADPAINLVAIEESWRLKVEELLGERQVLIERLDELQEKFRDLQVLYEQKLSTKEEEVECLRLRIMNLETAPRAGAFIQRTYRA